MATHGQFTLSQQDILDITYAFVLVASLDPESINKSWQKRQHLWVHRPCLWVEGRRVDFQVLAMNFQVSQADI